MTNSQSQATEVLAAVAAAAQGAATRAGLAARLSETLRTFGVEVARLDWLDDHDPRPPSIRRALVQRAPVVELGPEPGSDRLIETDRLVLPLVDEDGGEGALTVRPAAQVGWPSPTLVDDLARIVAAAQRSVRRIERLATVSRAAHHRVAELRERVPRGEVVGESPSMREVIDRIEQVAPYPTSVLIEGESGTGKERLARLLHRRSGRRGRFVAVNCGALPTTLVEAELFGHERGAFTGADARRRGRFEQAEGGTLMLDEVGDLPLAAQVKVLRTLQEQTVERVGGEAPIDVDVRIVAATHRDLAEMVAAGTFREDLYYRLATFPVRVPPLRERPEDLPRLVRSIVDDVAARLGRRAPAVDDDALQRLASRTWPGNVRELANTVERSMILFPGEVLRLVEEPSNAARRGRPRTFDDAARAAIEAALQQARGRVTGRGGAAEILALKPSTLQGKMRRLGIRRADFEP